MITHKILVFLFMYVNRLLYYKMFTEVVQGKCVKYKIIYKHAL